MKQAAGSRARRRRKWRPITIECLEPRHLLSAEQPRGGSLVDQADRVDVIHASTFDTGPVVGVASTPVLRPTTRDVDGTPPRIVAVSVPAARSFAAGASIRIAVRFSEQVGLVTPGPGSSPVLPVTVDNVTLSALFGRAVGRTQLAFTLTVPDGVDGLLETAGPVTLPPGTTLSDAAGNPAALELPAAALATLGRIRVDGVAPTAVDFSAPTLDASGRAATIVVRMSEPVVVRGSPMIRAIVGGTLRSLRYTAGTGTDRLAFTYRSPSSLRSTGIVSEDAIRVGGRAAIRDRAGNAYGSTGSVGGVTTVDGAPAAQRTVHLLDGLTLTRVRSTTTTDEGRYAFDDVPSGRYVVIGEGGLGGVATPVDVGSGSREVDVASLGDEVFDPIAIDSRPCCQPGVGVYVIDDPAEGQGLIPVDMDAARNHFSAIVDGVRDAGEVPYRVVNRISRVDERRRVDFTLFIMPWADTFRLVDVDTGRIVDAGWLDETSLTGYLTEGILEHLPLPADGEAPREIEGTDTFADLAGGPHHRHVTTTSSDLFLGGLLVYGAFAGRHGILFGRDSDAVIERVTIVAEDYTGVDVDGRPGTTVVFLGCDALGVWQKVEVGVVRPNGQADPGVVIDSAQHGLVRVDAVVLISYEAIFRSLTFQGKERCSAADASAAFRAMPPASSGCGCSR
ncbi:MAG: hypothetical protein EBS51_05530 [Planctomycetia bacterium]|nr:hypothetical protein [Planctomycetia bacterium]